MKIAIVGSGISGLSAYWLLSQNHQVTLYEKDDTAGGHSNTVDVDTPEGVVPVDTGFIVYNVKNYPNLIKLFEHLKVETNATDMSFSVSRNRGTFEYSGGSIHGLFAQIENVLKPRFWKMLYEIAHFYKEGRLILKNDITPDLSLGKYLEEQHYSDTFINDHLLPMAAAIWSAPEETLKSHPLHSFLKFCDNHGLIQLANRPQWRTVTGGSREYVQKILPSSSKKLCLNSSIVNIVRSGNQVKLENRDGTSAAFDHVIIATHADQALNLLKNPTPEEVELLGSFRYQRNQAILHSDTRMMPLRRRVWSSWNYMNQNLDSDRSHVYVSYWMNRLQNLNTTIPLFVTLNPPELPHTSTIHRSFLYQHPIFDHQSILAQPKLWKIQGQRNTWYCGSYFGSGFHEDGIQSGLAVAEALGKVRRPWKIENESGRIALPPNWNPSNNAA